MATEEFKLITEELFDNYVELREEMAQRKFENVSLSFKEYLDFYIRYKEVAEENIDDNENYEDYLDDSDDLDIEESK